MALTPAPLRVPAQAEMAKKDALVEQVRQGNAVARIAELRDEGKARLAAREAMATAYEVGLRACALGGQQALCVCRMSSTTNLFCSRFRIEGPVSCFFSRGGVGGAPCLHLACLAFPLSL
jgi:hypothetical protein